MGGGGRAGRLVTLKFLPIRFFFFSSAGPSSACLPIQLFVCLSGELSMRSPHVLYVCYSQACPPFSLALYPTAFRGVDLFCYLVASCFLYTVYFDLIWILILIPLLILIQLQIRQELRIFISIPISIPIPIGIYFSFVFCLILQHDAKFPFDYVYKSI